VISVRLVGAEGQEARRLLALVEAMGLRPLAFRPGVSTDAVVARLRRAPGVLWADVRYLGGVAFVEVRLGEPEPPVAKAPGDLVAARAGVVTRVIVLRGEATVTPGATVIPGEILIRGEERDAAGAYVPVPAEGAVFARVFETVAARVPTQRILWRPVGRPAVVVSLALGRGHGLYFRLPLPGTVSAERMRLSPLVRVMLPKLGRWAPAFRLSLAHGERRVVVRRGSGEAVALLRRTLREEARRRLGGAARWLWERERLKIDANEVRGTLTVEAEVDIATPRPLPSRPERGAE